MNVFLDDDFFTYALHQVNVSSLLLSDYISLVESIPEPPAILYMVNGFYNLSYDGTQNFQICFSPSDSYREHRDLYMRLGFLIDRAQEYVIDDYFDGENLYDNNFQYIANMYAISGILTGYNYSECGWWDDNKMMKISVDENYHPMFFFRKSFKESEFNDDTFVPSLSALYPNLYFNSNKNKIKLNNFGFSLHLIKDWVLDTLAYLNDHAVNDYLDSSDTFKAVAMARGVELSPESSGTHSTRGLMEERDILVNGMTVRCEWHAKFRYNSGRIHFHFGTNLDEKVIATTDGRLIVGIFCDHLPV